MRTWFVIWLLAPSSAAAADSADSGRCDSLRQLSDLARHIDAALAAYQALDPTGFEAATQAASEALSCVDGVVPTQVAARYHRLEALRQYAVPNDEAVRLALRAARVLDPTYSYPDALVPPEHELRVLYDGLSGWDEGPGVAMPEPLGGRLYLDGQERTERPIDRAVVFQLIDGPAVQTAYLYPSDPLMPYPVEQSAVAGTRRGSRVVWWSVAASSLVGAGATYGLAWSANNRFHDTGNEGLTADDLRALQRRSWVLSGVSVGLVVVGAGTGVGGWVAR